MAGRYDLLIDQGSTLTRDFVWKDTDGPIDITGYTLRMQMRQHPTSPDPPVFDSSDHAGSLTITDATNGQFSLNLTDEITAAFPAPFTGAYDIELEAPDGVVTRVVEGRVQISANVTR